MRRFVVSKQVLVSWYTPIEWRPPLEDDPSRTEFASRAIEEQAPVAELCREHGISRRTGDSGMPVS